MATCQYRYETLYPAEAMFTCNEPSVTNSESCIFHDKDHYAEHEKEAINRFREKVRESISQNKPLECFGYYVPAINFAQLLEGKNFAHQFTLTLRHSINKQTFLMLLSLEK